jgi:hypothetical protein
MLQAALVAGAKANAQAGLAAGLAEHLPEGAGGTMRGAVVLDVPSWLACPACAAQTAREHAEEEEPHAEEEGAEEEEPASDGSSPAAPGTPPGADAAPAKEDIAGGVAAGAAALDAAQQRALPTKEDIAGSIAAGAVAVDAGKEADGKKDEKEGEEAGKGTWHKSVMQAAKKQWKPAAKAVAKFLKGRRKHADKDAKTVQGWLEKFSCGGKDDTADGNGSIEIPASKPATAAAADADSAADL